MPGWTTRSATSEDIGEIQDVEHDAGRRFHDIGLQEVAEDDPPSTPVILAHVDAATAWVAIADHRVVGYSLASVVDGEGHLDQVSVRQSFAGRGIGRGLIEGVHDWAREQGFTAVTLTTFRDVRWNARYYEDLGYSSMSAEDLGVGLAAIRSAEVASGLDATPRIAMSYALTKEDE